MTTGAVAPDFTLMDQKGQNYNLHERLAKNAVILVFYPYDQSPTCTRQLCAINKDLDEFAQNGLEVFGINNADADTHNVFAKRKFLHLRLLSDYDYAVSKAYDCLWQIGPIKVIRRSVVGIDSSGVIRYLNRGVPSNKNILTDFLNALNSP